MAETRILYIEGSDTQRRELKTSLVERGFEVRDAASGEKGLEALETQGFDVVLCDLNMPGMSGMEVLERLKVSHPYLPLIFVTAHPSVPLAVQAIQNGAYRFLTKPIRVDELELTIYQAIEHARMQRWLREADEQLRLLDSHRGQ